MRIAVVVVTLLASAQARPQLEPLLGGFDYTTLTTTHRPFIPVLSRSEVRDEAGQLALNYKSGDGTILDQRAVLKPSADGKRTVLVQQGTYSYISPDGTPIQVSYIADETGFHPVGSHILTGDSPAPVPVAPPQPPPPPSVPVARPPVPVPALPVVPKTSLPFVQAPLNSPSTSPYRLRDPPYVVPATSVSDTSLPSGFFRVF